MRACGQNDHRRSTRFLNFTDIPAAGGIAEARISIAPSGVLVSSFPIRELEFLRGKIGGASTGMSFLADRAGGGTKNPGITFRRLEEDPAEGRLGAIFLLGRFLFGRAI